jgi:hypothetical protein
MHVFASQTGTEFVALMPVWDGPNQRSKCCGVWRGFQKYLFESLKTFRISGRIKQTVFGPEFRRICPMVLRFHIFHGVKVLWTGNERWMWFGVRRVCVDGDHRLLSSNYWHLIFSVWFQPTAHTLCPATAHLSRFENLLQMRCTLSVFLLSLCVFDFS